jgi:NADPH:quinone reductase-like Zn-dependent oxidoreductase
MYAAVVRSFTSPPRYEDIAVPAATAEDEIVIDVLAAGLHPRVRSQAAGSHYTSTEELPLIPGIDGVGRGPDGLLRYFVLPDTTMGSMAEQTVIDLRRSVVLPESSDAIAVAAAMNPAMSSWLALRHRIQFQPGQSVLVLGATGNAGQLAVQVAKLFGAERIIAAGRNPERLAALPALGATATVSFDGTDDELAIASDGVDVVLDYVWGETTGRAMAAIVTRRKDDAQPLSWIEIGSVSGPTAPIPSAALRATNLQIIGSGQGSVGTREILAELPSLAAAITDGRFAVAAVATPLADVEAAWTDPAATSNRIVLAPAP